MASESDGEDELEAEFSSMKQPPLIKQLQGILSEYPDGGQIIKELLQNAEDAGANKVRILYDDRPINREVDKKKTYRKFFKGPALCLYNDALFTDTDWEGIKMIYSSVKEDDPLKVGRFGLGFKSVFHITDNPCVISGSRLLLIDPQQSSERVNASMDLNKLERYGGMDTDAFLLALGDLFGITRDLIRRGHYPGTVFWFPLRDTPSPLSETLYDKAKVLDLFEVFKCEADSILLFLRNLTSISLGVRATDIPYEEVAKVDIIENIEEVEQKRNMFQSEIRTIPVDYNGESIHCSYAMTIRTQYNENGNANVRHKKEMLVTSTKWSIVNYFMGKGASKRFRSLIKDPHLGYSPYVGVAMPMLESRAFQGHVFCFLPLPKEGRKLTGLPVHVNGFFALSQNRHHLKWVTDEQKGKRIEDKSILWNETLIKEALPLAYEILIENNIDISKREGNTDESVKRVYDAIPDDNKVTKSWKGILPVLFDKMKSKRFLFFKNQQSVEEGTWIGVKEACFASLKLLTVDLQHVKKDIVNILHLLQQKYVAIPGRLFDTLSMRYQVRDMSPQKLYELLRKKPCYKKIPNDYKISLLIYLLSENDHNYNSINGLQLLPLASGEWTTFQKLTNPVYICSTVEMSMFPGLEDAILKNKSEMPDHLNSLFEAIGNKGCFQIRMFTPTVFKSLLTQTIDKNLGSGSQRIITSTCVLSVDWLSHVWTYIHVHGLYSNFKDVPLIPLLLEGSWEHGQSKIQLLCVRDTMILKKDGTCSLPETVCDCLEAVSVKVLPSLPHWFTKSDEIFLPNQASVARLLSKLNTSEERLLLISSFNDKCALSSREGLVQFLGSVSAIDNNAKIFLKQLNIFRETESPNAKPRYVSLGRNNSFTRNIGFPVRFPRPLLEVRKDCYSLVELLGASEVTYTSLVQDTLKSIQHGRYNQDEIVMFMDYFVGHFQDFEEETEMINIAKTIPFLKTKTGILKPSDLFNPDDDTLQDLYLEEPKFPDRHQAGGKRQLIALKCLGLKEVSDVNTEELLQVGQTLDTWSRSFRSKDDIQRKATAFMKHLTNYPSVLKKVCQYPYTLAYSLKDLQCIIPNAERMPSFAECLPWYCGHQHLCMPSEIRDESKCKLVGSTMPLVSASNNVSDEFEWNMDPPVKSVLEQLTVVKEHFSVGNQTEMLPIVKSIYHFFERVKKNFFQENFKMISKEIAQNKLIWNGEGFSDPKQIVVATKPHDIDLQPYFFRIPGEFRTFSDLYVALGCNNEQTIGVLLECLFAIDKKYQIPHDEFSVNSDVQIVVKILNNIAARKDKTVDELKAILIPVEYKEKDVIKMKSVDECVYDRDPLDYMQEDGDDPVFVVHSAVPLTTAKSLGVRSLDRKALSDTEELDYEEWGQDEPLTARINSLLKEGYVDGLSVPKELIQNADDAGATAIKILYDERTNDDAKVRLLSSGMQECQGPALWVYNNASFSREDLENITKLNGATKEKKARTIGKFGLGFCSVYNLTDVPSFVSGTNIVIFDPHKKYLEDALPGNSPGLKIDFSKQKNKSLLKRHSDQFKPFNGIFGCDLGSQNDAFEGTLFRFPLRTFEQSQRSKICQKIYSEQEVRELLSMFISVAGNMLLFTQNIQEIDVYHLQRNSCVEEQILLFSISNQCLQLNGETFQPIMGNVLSKLSKTNEIENFVEIQRRVITQNITKAANKLIPNIGTDQSLTSPWIISWASGTNESLDLYKKGNKYVYPLSAIGIPCDETKVFDPIELQETKNGFYKDGHMFCFLPLPIATGLHMHVNGSFDITSDRRQLMSLTEDDKGPKSNDWNEVLMKDALVNSFIHLLQFLSTKASYSYSYHCLWPNKCKQLVSHFKMQFYRRMIDDGAKIFKGDSKWVAFNEVVFLDPMIRENSAIGDVAYKTLKMFAPRQGKILIEMPQTILSALIKSNNNRTDMVKRAIIQEDELLSVFLKNIHNPLWEPVKEQRDQMILYTLQSESTTVKAMIKTVACIPTEPNGELKTPGQLVNPSSNIAELFLASDGRFPVDNKFFRSKSILEKLEDVGMMSKSLPETILLERCQSISEIATSCCDCAFNRCVHVLNYLSISCKKISLTDETSVTIKDIHMLPVLTRPKDWKFSWKADSCQLSKRFERTGICSHHTKYIRDTLVLGKPSMLYRQKGSDYIGSVESLVDESSHTPSKLSNFMHQAVDVFKLIGVYGTNLDEIAVNRIVEHIGVLSSEYTDSKTQSKELAKLYRKTFDHLATRLKDDIDKRHFFECLQTLQNKPVILIGKELVKPQTVTYNVKEECIPYLNRLPKHEQMCRLKPLYHALGVREHFAVSDIVHVLKIKKERWHQQICDEIEVIVNILSNLEESILKETKTYHDCKNDHEYIVGPDINGFLWPTYELVIDDDNYQTSSNMHILHGRVANELAKCLGVKSKDRKCLENISYGIPFGQREKLVTRLKKLLNAYLCDSSIMKELLQNADDAGATEICFIKDYRAHPPLNSFFSDKLQGPALCVFNNSYFKPEDFEGIHNLGEGSKTGDPTKTGQYGVGFNAVYHLTDTPMFMTKGPGLDNGGALCIFDPLCEHIPNVEEHEPGRRYEVEGLRNDFKEILSGFENIEQLCKGNKGTIFRLPLRSEPSVISKEEISIAKSNEVLSVLMDDMFEALLFVKNVNCIKVSNVSSGSLVDEYVVRVVLSKQDQKKRKEFFSDVFNIAAAHKLRKIDNLKVKPREVQYEMKIEDNRGKCKTWFVVQRFGFGLDMDLPEVITETFIKEELGALPLGGIAMEISGLFIDSKYTQQSGLSQTVKQTQSEEWPGKAGKAFCFLPLPIETGLPIHVNGHFALDHESRREMWKWKDGYRSDWNECILQYVIAPAYVTAVNYLKMSLVDVQLKSVGNWRELNMLMSRYHGMFPLWETAKTEFWKSAVAKFYMFILEKNNPLFPVVRCNNAGFDNQNARTTRQFSISWTHLTCSSGSFGAVFNDILKHVPKPSYGTSITYRQEAFLLEEILKDLGMRLIQTPIAIYKTIRKVDIEAATSTTPMCVVQFLKLFESDEVGCCRIKNINVTIDKTNFYSIKNLKYILWYIMIEKDCLEHIEGLPVLLTADFVLRKFSSQEPAYVLKFDRLLPASTSNILHYELLEMLDQKVLYDKGLIKKLGISDFLSLLPQSYSQELFAGNKTILWNKENGKPLHPEYIQQLFQFVYEESLAKQLPKIVFFTKDTIPQVNHETFQTNIQQLQQWSFLPSVEQAKPGTKNELIPIGKFYCLVYRSTLWNAKLASIFEKMNLPTLDISVFRECAYASTLQYGIQKILASTDKPYELLLCFLYYKPRIELSELNSDDALEVLSYFVRMLEFLKQKGDDSLVQKLRSLPMYALQQGTLVSIEHNTDVLIMPDTMPQKGMQEWANSTGVTLLKQYDVIKPLYDYLKLSLTSVLDLYLDEILPKMNHLPLFCWLDHIAFIMDELLNCFRDYTDKQKKIILLLKHLRFIDVNGEMKRVNELYCRDHPVFRVMLKESQFLPMSFCTEKWRKLFEDLGFNVKPDDRMMIQFAREVQTESRNGLSKELCVKSNILVEHFISNIWQPNTLKVIKKVQFVIPYRVSPEMRRIYSQPNDASLLVCFDGSLSYTHQRLCWSSLNLFPDWVSVDGDIANKLGIYVKPPLEKVVTHCQNICDVLKQLLVKKQVSKEFVKMQMEDLYNFFESHTNKTETFKQRLQQTPFIFKPNENVLVMCHEIVINLTDEEEIKPYLYRAPTYYGRYHDLFVRLGSQKNITSSIYATILQTMKIKIKDEEMVPQELHIIRSVIRNLFRILNVSKQSDLVIGTLYLPNRQKIIVDSKTLTVSNNRHIEQRIGTNNSINFFIGFRELDIYVIDQVDEFKKLPERLRPQFLTDIVTEQICTDDIFVIEEDRKARLIEDFIHSSELIEGVIRLVKHQIRLGNIAIEQSQVDSIAARLQNVKIVKVTGLKTILRFRDTVVNGSAWQKQCFIKEETKGDLSLYTLFFQEKRIVDMMDISDLMEEDGGVIDLIQKCANHLVSPERQLVSILRLIGSPNKIKEKLDMLHVDEYDLPHKLKGSAFPRPGTYVEEKFHPFLVQGIYPFTKHEYKFVALELEDDAMDQDDDDDDDDVKEPLYIYVHILREEQLPNIMSHLRLRYVVDTGDYNMTSETVPIYRLYRFVRQEAEGTEVVVYDDEPVGTVAFDERCRRVREMLKDAWQLPEKEKRRVIRRLLMKWHPDKNLGNEEYCKRIFNYIYEVISKLERGESIDDNVDNETGRTHPDTSGSSYYGMGCNINRRAQRYARAYRDNVDEYNRSQRSGNYAHHSANRAVRPDHGEAKRWLRQAKNDYRTAEVCLPTAKDVDGYNWICYKCHQASEKALKAVWFSKDGNCAPRMSHSLTMIAANLTNDMIIQARLLETRLGEHTRMQYPDSASRPQIPSDVFTLDDATFSMGITKTIICLAEDYI